MKQIPHNIAKHFKEVFFGGNWSFSNVKDTLEDVTWKEAIQQIEGLNTIAILSYHIGYFVTAVTQVLEGGVLDANDKFSFSHPPINCEEDWEQMRARIINEASHFAGLIEVLSGGQLDKDFTDAKYGSYYRNLHGIIEHTHYHLGQISLIKKLIRSK